MKKNKFILLIILLFAIVLRLIFIDKPDGLWNDEYVSWMIASKNIGSGFWEAIKSQCHMPLYYFYLKFVMLLFGNSDLILRLSSVLTGLSAIPVMFLVGKEKDEQTGMLCAGFCAISSFLIYYSQEVRLYSILFLISALCLLYTIRLINNPNRKNLILCILYNLLIILTHTIGFVFVFFNLLFISFKLFKNYKKIVLSIWSIIILSSCPFLGLAYKIMTMQTFSQWWNHFSISQIGFLITDYFSPILTNLTSAPSKFLYLPAELIPVMLIPAILAIICIIKSCHKNKFNLGLFLVAFGTVMILAVASISGKLVFITKYSIEIYPILIYLACTCRFDNKKINNIIIILYCLLSLGYLLFHPYSAPKMHRAEGHNIPVQMLKNMQLKKDDYILLIYYPHDRFEKYFDFSDYNVISVNKGNFVDFISNDITYNDVYKNGKAIYKNLFLSDNNNYLGNKLKKEIFDNMRVGQSIVMVVLNSVAFYTPEEIKQIAKDDNLYSQTPLLFLVFSYLKKEIFYDSAKIFVPQKVEKKGNWMVVKFTKVNN